MATIRRPRFLLALGVLALVPAALTACGGGADNGGDGSNGGNDSTDDTNTTSEPAADQSTEEACTIVTDGMTEIQTNISDLMSKATSGDTEAVNTLMEQTSSDITAIKDEVTNEEVGTAFGGFADSYQQIADVVADLTELDASDPEAADKATELSNKVSEASTGLTDAASDLTEVCGG